jgi:uncharacterized protein YjeT (DUF2065 family)
VRRRQLGSLALSLVLVLGGWLVAGRPPLWHEADPPRGGLAELQDLAQLQARFNADAGMTRLILLLSPT